MQPNVYTRTFDAHAVKVLEFSLSFFTFRFNDFDGVKLFIRVDFTFFFPTIHRKIWYSSAYALFILYARFKRVWDESII